MEYGRATIRLRLVNRHDQFGEVHAMRSQILLIPALFFGLLFGRAATIDAADPAAEAEALVATASKDWYKHYAKASGEFSRRMAARLVLKANTPLERLLQTEAYRYFNRQGEAWKIYNELSDEFPNSAMLHCHIAMAFIEAGDYKTAKLKIDAANRADSESAYVFAARGALLQAQEQREAAFEQYTEALRRNPYIYGLRGRRVLLAWLSEPDEPRLSDLTINSDYTVSARRTSWHRGSSWTSPGKETFVFTLSDGRARYEGTLAAKNRMVGTGRDLGGASLTWRALRIHEPAENVP
ncbi:tetratricopeptide repeat protein [Novipirellula maiorica]|nr:hypothetical protein [Rhodopirellula maiorica]